jgi:hypothetical protein
MPMKVIISLWLVAMAMRCKAVVDGMLPLPWDD